MSIFISYFKALVSSNRWYFFYLSFFPLEELQLLTRVPVQVRGQMVLFPVLYGLCQLAEVFVATGLFQAWVFAHRHDVTEEATISVVDTSVLTSIPVPAHKDSPVRLC